MLCFSIWNQNSSGEKNNVYFYVSIAKTFALSAQYLNTAWTNKAHYSSVCTLPTDLAVSPIHIPLNTGKTEYFLALEHR